MERQRDKAMHPGQQVAWQAREARQVPLQTTQPDRVHARAPKGLATSCQPLRQVPQDLPLCRCPRRNRHVLAMTRERVLTLGMPLRVHPRSGSSKIIYRALRLAARRSSCSMSASHAVSAKSLAHACNTSPLPYYTRSSTRRERHRARAAKLSSIEPDSICPMNASSFGHAWIAASTVRSLPGA